MAEVLRLQQELRLRFQGWLQWLRRRPKLLAEALARL